MWQAGADLAGGLRCPISPRHWEMHSWFSHSSTGPNLPRCHTQAACPLALVWHLVSPELWEPGSTKFRQDPTINLTTSQDFWESFIFGHWNMCAITMKQNKIHFSYLTSPLSLIKESENVSWFYFHKKTITIVFSHLSGGSTERSQLFHLLSALLISLYVCRHL